MAKGRKTYPAEYKARLIEMARAGRTAESLARDFEPTAQTIRNWVKQADYPVSRLCRLLGVSRSGFYEWRDRPVSKRARVDAELTEVIKRCHLRSRGTYGRPRIFKDLTDLGYRVGRKRVARLMRQAALQGVSRRKGPRTTRRGAGSAAPDLVKRAFTADRPDQLWVADVTYVPTWSGFLYLAVIIDVWSRRVVGWSMATHLRKELVMQALNMATTLRQPKAVIHHSDQGSQYTSLAFGKRCEALGVRQSMGSVGDCFDNALAESFFASLECELIDRSAFQNRADAQLAVFDYIEGWYNPHRRHSALGLLSPINFEHQAQAALAA